MRAGSGIIHDERPTDEMKAKGGLARGIQLWINLPAEHEMSDPMYYDVKGDEVPVIEEEGFRARLFSGSFGGKVGVIKDEFTPLQYIFGTVSAGSSKAHTLPLLKGHQGFVYVLKGDGVKVGGLDAKLNDCVVVNNLEEGAEDAAVEIVGAGGAETEFIMATGVPTNAPVYRRGPFVLSSQEALYQAFVDMQNGDLVKVKAEKRS